jgi:hypothetical protein
LRETKFAEVGNVSDEQLAVYASAASAMRRLFESLGLKRRSRDITPITELTDLDQTSAVVDVE